MNITLLEAAKKRVPNAAVLVNMVSKRVRQLIAGQRPMIKVADQNEEFDDIALREIAEGKLVAEIDFDVTKK
jgi:DNA-directed RNA polymerase subunit omega